MNRHELTRRDAISLVGAVGLGVSTARLLGFESQRPTSAQSDKAQLPTQASTAPKRAATLTALMPQPRSAQYGDGWLPVKGDFQVEWLGYRNSMLDRAVSRIREARRREGVRAASESVIMGKHNGNNTTRMTAKKEKPCHD